nr:hypothetical protein [Anaerolineae bacterium]
PTNLPWGLTLARRVPPFTDLAVYPGPTRFQPTPAYASLAALFSVGVYYLVDWKSNFPLPKTVCIAVIVYLTCIFFLDFLRVDVSSLTLGLSAVQVLAVLLSTGALVLCLKLPDNPDAG